MNDRLRMSEFVIDSSSGYWGLSTPEEKEKLRESLCRRTHPQKHYNGVQLIVLNTTNECNLGCVYCSTTKHRSKKSMPLEIATMTIDRTEDLEELPRIVFHGSEPLLNIDTIKGMVLYGEEFYKRRGKEILFSIQTNLTLLTQDKIDFIKEHKIGISTSIDGREEEHNMNRPYKDGMPSYFNVCKGLEKVLEFQKGMCTVCVITKNNVDSLDKIALEFEKMGITEVQFIPSVSCGGESNFRPSNEALSKSYIKLFEQTFQRLRENSQKIRVKDITQYLSALFLRTGIDACRICTPSNQHSILAVDINGDIYPCDFFWSDNDKIIGNVKTDTFKSILNSPSNLRMVSIEETFCGDCKWRKICGGGCLGDRIFSGGKPYYCDTHRNIFEYLSKNISNLLEEGLIKKIFDVERS